MERAVGRLPISEVVLSISFEESEVLAGPRLPVVLQDLLATYSEIEEQLPYEMPEELPTKRQLMRPQPNFQIVGPMGPTKRRYWLTKPDDKSILIQAQSDYFAVNWRRQPAGNDYPGFEGLKATFFELFSVFQMSLRQRAGLTLNVQQAELSYINVIRPSIEYSDHSFLQEVIDVRGPVLGEIEQLGLSFTRALHSPDGVFLGRSYTNVQTAFQFGRDVQQISLTEDPDMTAVLNLTTSVRSARQKSLTLEEVSNVLEYEHDEATRSFRAVTTEEAQTAWGIA